VVTVTENAASDETGSTPRAAAAAEAPDYRDLFLRATAELDNYRKRAERDRLSLMQYANETLIRRLLDPLDSFDRAIGELERAQRDTAEPARPAVMASLEGVRALKRQFNDQMAAEGLEAFRPDGEPFDPQFHEALVRIPRDDTPEGTIVQVLQPGYILRGKLLRPARVAVSAGPAPDAGAQPESDSNSKAAGRKSGAPTKTN